MTIRVVVLATVTTLYALTTTTKVWCSYLCCLDHRLHFIAASKVQRIKPHVWHCISYNCLVLSVMCFIETLTST